LLSSQQTITQSVLNKIILQQKRIQLTLFIDEAQSAIIEKIRRQFNPVQYGLIKAHVTLCREDELEQTDKVMLNLDLLNCSSINITFGKPVQFSDGKGLLLPAIGNNETFQQLRAAVLQGAIKNPRQHQPHITLLHPRTTSCTGAIFKHIAQEEFPSKINFKKISLIEQEIENKWQVLKELELN
jgi:2'-5' RNA ligase